MSIQVKNINKRFSTFKALDDISLDFPTGKLVALLGPSGCGKTTLLRIIAGLESADGGQVILEGEDATDVHVRERQVGFVFQHYALFRHMTVFENIAFGLRVRPRATRPSEAEIKKRVTRLLDLVQLGFLADRFPAQLSGGQRQRIGIARSLVMQPDLVIADEPISALDVSVRAQVLNLLKKFQKELGLTYLFIAHDLSVVRFISDRIAVIHKGVIVEVAETEELFRNPIHPYTRSLLSAVPIPDPILERQKTLIVYNPDQHDYSVDKPEMVEVKPGHYVWCNQSELAQYKKDYL